jgi:hypothetical protein
MVVMMIMSKRRRRRMVLVGMVKMMPMSSLHELLLFGVLQERYAFCTLKATASHRCGFKT